MVDVEKGIEPNDEIEIRRRAELPFQGSDGINGIGFSFAADFDIGEIERRRSGDGKPDHFIAIRCGCQRSIPLVGRIAGRNKEHSVESQPVSGFARNCQVAVMNGIETAAEESQLERRGG